MNTIRFLYIISIFISPLISHAQIEISEIMYDYEGSDSGNEWIEIHNTSSSAINLEDWSFRENEVNHGLQFQGSSTIDPDARMVIVQNIEQFFSQYENTILVIKSSFSLNNTGEILEIVNENDEVVDSHRYTSETGAQGDGNSLQKIDDQWVSGAPTPGESNQQTTQSTSDTESSSDTTNTSSDTSDDRIVEGDSREQPVFEDYYEPYITFPDVLVAHAPERFEVGVFHVKEHSRTRKLRGVYYLNFGDGTVIESGERIDQIHRYPAPGSYLVTFEYYTSTLSYQHKEPELIYQKNIEVVAPRITISGSDTHGGIQLTNTGSKNIDVSGWRIQGGGAQYTFPRQSIIRPSSTIVISHTSLGFWVDDHILEKLYITNDTNMLIHQYEPPHSTAKEPTESSVDTPSDTTDDIQLGEHTLYLDDNLKTEDSAVVSSEIDSGEQVYEYAHKEVEAYDTQHQYIAVVFGSLVIVTGFTRYLYLRKRRYRQSKKNLEILE